MPSRPSITLKTQADWDRLQTTARGQARLNRIPTPLVHIQGDVKIHTDSSLNFVIEKDAKPTLILQGGGRATVDVQDNAQPLISVTEGAAPDITVSGKQGKETTIVVEASEVSIYSRRPNIVTKGEAKPSIVLSDTISIVSCEEKSAPHITVQPTASIDIHFKDNARPTVADPTGNKHTTLSGAGRLLTRSTGKTGTDWTVERPFRAY